MLEKQKVQYEEFMMFNSDKKTHTPLYIKYIPDRPLQAVFIRLASLMTPFWNSVPYKSIRELAKITGFHQSKLLGKIKTLERLNAITTVDGYLYINPYLATKSRDVELSTLKHFLSETGEYDEENDPVFTFTITQQKDFGI